MTKEVQLRTDNYYGGLNHLSLTEDGWTPGDWCEVIEESESTAPPGSPDCRITFPVVVKVGKDATRTLYGQRDIHDWRFKR